MQNKKEEITVQDLVNLLLSNGVQGDWPIRLTSDTGVDQSPEGEVVIEDIMVNHYNKTLDVYVNVRLEDEDYGSECDYD